MRTCYVEVIPHKFDIFDFILRYDIPYPTIAEQYITELVEILNRNSDVQYIAGIESMGMQRNYKLRAILEDLIDFSASRPSSQKYLYAVVSCVHLPKMTNIYITYTDLYRITGGLYEKSVRI